MMGRSATVRAATALVAVLACAACATSGQTPYSATNKSAGVTFGNVTRGVQVFDAACAACHGAGGSGGVGPTLIGENHRKNYEGTVAWIQQPEPPMPQLYPAPLSQRNVEDVATYVQSL